MTKPARALLIDMDGDGVALDAFAFDAPLHDPLAPPEETAETEPA